MAFSLASTDVFPYLAGVFRCDECEHEEPTEGRSAAIPPPGWVSEPRDGELRHLCPACAAKRPARH